MLRDVVATSQLYPTLDVTARCTRAKIRTPLRMTSKHITPLLVTHTSSTPSHTFNLPITRLISSVSSFGQDTASSTTQSPFAIPEYAGVIHAPYGGRFSTFPTWSLDHEPLIEANTFHRQSLHFLLDTHGFGDGFLWIPL